MASFTRYTLRLGIIVALLLTSGAVFATSRIVNDVQANITTMQEIRTQYLQLDENILDQLENIKILMEGLVNSQLELYFTSILEGIAETPSSAQLFDLFNSVTDITSRLTTRQLSNYQLTGLISGFLGLGTMGLEIPDTVSIIQKIDGASELFGDFAIQTNERFTSIRNDGQNFRNDLELSKNQFELRQQEFTTLREYYLANITEFENQLFDNDTQAAYEIIEVSNTIRSNMSQLFQAYGESVTSLAQSPTESTSFTFNITIISVSNGIQQANATISSLGLAPSDQLFYDSLINSTLSNINKARELSFTLNQISSIHSEIGNYLDGTIEDIQTELIPDIDAVEQFVLDENELFEEVSITFLRDLRTRLNSNITLIFVILSTFIGIIFLWIFYTLSRNLGRILDKNQKLADGDLSIRKQENYGQHELGIVEQSVDNYTEQIRSILNSMTDSAETLAGISEELAAGAEEAAASITQVSETIGDFSSGSVEQNIMLTRVRDELINHLNVVEQTANSIDETASFVLRVAKRTNILGLNASIEAAKAGRFGIGFNTVAEEVRSLSDETKESATGIASSIESIEYNIRKTVQDILNEVNIIREVAENTTEGSSNASLATSDQVVMMNEVSDTSTQLSELSQQLNSMLQDFKF